MLASDLNNPDFVNPLNPDSMLHVEFYMHAALDKTKTDETGIKSYKDECPFVRIMVPGNDKTIIERPAEKRDAEKWPLHWQRFQMSQQDMPMDSSGWGIDSWDELNSDQVRQLKYLRFLTVEQIAGANDAQILAIGMGGEGLRIKAKKAIAERYAQDMQAAVSERSSEVEALKEQLKQQAQQMEQLMEMMKERKPGRPPKEHA
jgi:hypothetical protein